MNFIALIPILWLLAGLSAIKMPAHKVCSVGLVISLMLALFSHNLHWVWALQACLEGLLFAIFPILWVVLAAFFMYNIAQFTGAIEQIKQFMLQFSSDRRIQALLIAWGFGSFMESVAGFGTAVAVPAALMIALGFSPLQSAIICLIANTVAVAFGVLGIPITTLARVTELNVFALSTAVVWQLGLFVFAIPVLIVLSVTREWSGFRGVGLVTLTAGASFAFTQYFVATSVGPELAAVLASLVSSAAIIGFSLYFPVASPWKLPHELRQNTEAPKAIPRRKICIRSQGVAWSPYLVLLILVLASSRLSPEIHNFLQQFRSVLLLYSGPGGKPLIFDWWLTPGTLLFIAAIIGGRIQGASPHRMLTLFLTTALQLRKTALTVITLVAMAKVLAYSGMIDDLAQGLAQVSGSYFPLFSPLIGVLGAFITGSDTSANILFGQLQKQTAIQLGMDPVWIAAANASGACIGKMISPQSIAIATAATGLSGQEGQILCATIRLAVPLSLIMSLLVYYFAF